ncbi:MAG: DUF1579 family protein [Deltaproteobacteria bacterium]|nr:DUF1579 family protein [Deltaproteobacteria bacterium]
MLFLPICLALLGVDPMHHAATHPAPGPEHARLATLAGTWDVELTVWQKAGALPEKSRGFAVVEPLFGGLFVQERMEGLAGEVPFVELTWLGFDPASKRYQLTRIGSGAAAMATRDGTFDERQQALVLEGPAAIAGDRERRTLRLSSADERIVQCQRVPRSGEPWQSCELRYTRRKG